jgi:hypothetical protein
MEQRFSYVAYSMKLRARICKRLRSPGIDSASLCSLAGCKGCRTGNRFLGSSKGLQTRAQLSFYSLGCKKKIWLPRLLCIGDDKKNRKNVRLNFKTVSFYFCNLDGTFLYTVQLAVCVQDHRVHTRYETGSVYLPTQLERTLQLYW